MVMLAVLAAGAFWVGTHVGVGPDVAYAQGTPSVNHRAATLNGRTVGEVLVNDQIVIRMRTSAGGMSPQERGANHRRSYPQLGLRAVLSL